jgi:ribonuclease BN (tRNA processing enzyme)
MCAYYVARNYRAEGCPAPLPVFGPAGTAERLARAYDMDADPGMKQVFDFHDLSEGSFGLGPLTVTAVRVAHPVEAYGFRVEHRGRAFAYTGDTGPCAQLADLARDSELLLAEAAYTDGKEEYVDVHLNGRQAGLLAAESGTRRLVLTHIPPWTDPERNRADAAGAYSGPVELARPGAVYRI